MRIRLLAGIVAAAALAAHPSAASAQALMAPPSPCADSLYRVLKAKPLDGLSEREYQYFIVRDAACSDYQRRTAPAAPSPTPPPAAEAPSRIESDTRSRETSNGDGADVFVRNRSDRPIIVTSVRVFDCVNIREQSCTIHYPRTRLRPGEERRVLTIRYVQNQNGGYRYTYHVSADTPESP